MSAVIFFVFAPVFVWLWRGEIIALVSDCIAEGIRKSEDIDE